MADSTARGIRSVQLGLAANAALALIKGVAGIVGNAYALVADAVESTADIFGSVIVWGGRRIRPGRRLACQFLVPPVDAPRRFIPPTYSKCDRRCRGMAFHKDAPPGKGRPAS